jgi:hypothetical protein
MCFDRRGDSLAEVGADRPAPGPPHKVDRRGDARAGRSAVLPFQVEAGKTVVDDGGAMGGRVKQQRQRAHEDVIVDDPVDVGPPQDVPQLGVLIGHPVDEDVLHDESKLLHARRQAVVLREHPGHVARVEVGVAVEGHEPGVEPDGAIL